MSGRLAVFWLPRVLFWAALLVSLFLILAVILSPLLEGTDLLAQCGRIQALFAGFRSAADHGGQCPGPVGDGLHLLPIDGPGAGSRAAAPRSARAAAAHHGWGLNLFLGGNVFDWLFEGHWYIYTVLALLALFFLWFWWQNRTRFWLIGLTVFLALIGIYWLLDILVETGREQIKHS